VCVCRCVQYRQWRNTSVMYRKKCLYLNCTICFGKECLFACLFVVARTFFSNLTAVTITTDRTANLDLYIAPMSFSSKASSRAIPGLRHGTYVNKVSSERTGLRIHTRVRSQNVRTIKSLGQCSIHFTTLVFVFIKRSSFKLYTASFLCNVHTK
jgi:hypothetical protein